MLPEVQAMRERVARQEGPPPGDEFGRILYFRLLAGWRDWGRWLP